MCSHRALGCAVHRAVHQVERRVFASQFFYLILGKIADLQPSRCIHLPFRCGELRSQKARERGLAISVTTEQRNAIVCFDPEVQSLEDWRRFAVTHGRLLQRDHRRSQLFRIREVKT